MTEITRILTAIDQGDAQAANKLLPLVYDELRRLAAHKLSHEKPGQTLQATALVHEAYLRLAGSENQNWDSRGHFFAAAAEAMRRILVENARRRQRRQQSGAREQVELDEVEPAIQPPSDDLIAVHEALDRLADKDRLKADLVKLRYFVGLTVPQAAEVLGVSHATADRYWAYAKAWLHQEIIKGDDGAQH